MLVASRLPRLLAGLTVGVALGFAGAALQSVARNPLASPDTLAVNAGAHLAIVAVGRLRRVPAGAARRRSRASPAGSPLPGWCWCCRPAGRPAPTRLILAGSATAIALNSLTMLLLLLFEQATIGLFAWGNGSLVQSDLTRCRQLAPVVLAGAAGLMLVGHRLDILALGDDTASVLGVTVRRTRLQPPCWPCCSPPRRSPSSARSASSACAHR